MAREKTIKVSEEEMAVLETARDRIFGTDTVPLGRVVDSLCGEDEPLDVEYHDEDYLEESGVTNTVVGKYHGNYDGRVRGVYLKGLDPSDFVGMVRRFTGKNIQYLQVVGDMDGHAVYRMINEGPTTGQLHSMPWDRFIEETARVNPDAPSTPNDDPARTVVREDFDRQRARRNQEVETGCRCLPDEPEACHQCGGK